MMMRAVGACACAKLAMFSITQHRVVVVVVVLDRAASGSHSDNDGRANAILIAINTSNTHSDVYGCRPTYGNKQCGVCVPDMRLMQETCVEEYYFISYLRRQVDVALKVIASQRVHRRFKLRWTT